MKRLLHSLALLFNGSVGRRLWVVQGVLVALTIVTGLMGLAGLKTLSGQLESSIQNQAAATELVNQMLEQGMRLSDSARRAAASSGVEGERALENLEVAKRALGELVDRISSQLEDQPELRSAIEEGFSTFVISAVKAGRLLQAGRQEEAERELLMQFEPKLLEYVLTTVSAIGERAEHSTRDVAASGRNGYERTRSLLLPLTVAALLAFGISQLIVRRTIVGPVRRTVRAAEQLADGRFDVNLHSRSPDECGEMLRAMARLRERLETVARVQEELLTAHRLGTLELRVAAGRLPGAYGELVQKVTEAVTNAHSAQQGVQREVLDVTAAIARGDFSRRLEVTGKEGIWLQLTLVLNELADSLEAAFRGLSHHLKLLSQGDLSQRVQARRNGLLGEVDTDLDQTGQKLSDMVTAIRQSSEIVTRAADAIASGNADLSVRSETQARELAEASGALGSLASMAQRGADNALAARGVMQTATEAVSVGTGMVGKVSDTMQQIASASSRIAETVDVIHDIAFRTNILALNAAVEAARAGDQGRGFAVVASEVRGLASKAAGAAREIEALIEDSVRKVESGKALTGEAGTAMENILVHVESATRLMTDISGGSSEQNERIRQLAGSIAEMDRVTQRNSAMVGEAAAAAARLQEEALALTDSVAAFRLADQSEQEQRTGT